MDLDVLGSNVKKQYIKIHHISTATVQSNTYILTICSLLHHVSCEKKRLILFYFVLLCFHSLQIVS
jgi:hypothetical protein